MNYVIEELSKDNVEEYVRVNALSWKQSYKGIVNDDFLELINEEDQIQNSIKRIIVNELTDNTNKGFVLRVDDKAVGMLRVGLSRNEKYNKEGELKAIYLLDEAKHKGYGKILFQKAIEELKKLGYKNIIIACLKENPSNEFYKHMGGKLVGTNNFKIPNQVLEENVYYFESI